MRHHLEHGDPTVEDTGEEVARASYFSPIEESAAAEPQMVVTESLPGAEPVAAIATATASEPALADGGGQLPLPEVPVRPRAPRRRTAAKVVADVSPADLPVAEVAVTPVAVPEAVVAYPDVTRPVVTESAVIEPAAAPVAQSARALTVVLPEPLALMARAMERAKEPLACPLCGEDGGELVLRLPACRVIRAVEPGFPAFYRVIWNSHVAEWTDLPESDQLGLMRVVNTVERTLRDLLHPTKINLASLGNVVPHLHWHVIARFDWDSHFPAPIWGPAQRKVEPAHTAVLEQLMPQVDEVLRQRLVAW